MPDPLSPNVQHLKASETVAISNEAIFQAKIAHK